MRIRPKTFYEDVVAFGERNIKSHGKLLEPRRESWQNQAYTAALRAQGHFALKSSAFFGLTDSVSVKNTPKELQRLKPYLRLPFPTCWLEIYQNDGPLGFVIEQTPEPWSIKLYTFQQKSDVALALNPRLAKGPYAIAIQATMNDETLETGKYTLEKGAWINEESDRLSIRELFTISKLILLMNCRRGPLHFANSQSEEFFAGQPTIETNLHKLALYNKQGRYPTHEIVFDFSRRLSQSMHDVTADDERVVIKETLVRGHFKVRRTGLFFWTPFERRIFGDSAEPPTVPQTSPFNQYAITRADPKPALVLPDHPDFVIPQARLLWTKPKLICR